MEVPEPQYVKTDDGAYLAYQVVGDGPVDIAWQFDFGGNIDVWWELLLDRVWFEGLASFGRLILHDWRGTGLSSRNVALPNLETRADDLRTVLDAAGSESTVLGAWFESLAPCVLLAARDPARVKALVWWNPNPRTVWAPDYPWGFGPDDVKRELEALEHWGTAGWAETWADQFEEGNGQRPSDDAVRWMAKQSRNTCTPDVAAELTKIWYQTDIRAVLPTVQVPTLLIYGEEEGSNPAIAEHVAGLMRHATIAEHSSTGWPSGRAEAERAVRPLLETVQRFVGVEPRRGSVDTILSTVLFTDIVGPTEHQARLGDHGWKELVERHHATVREALSDWRGVENDTAGDGFYATFDGPARAIHCALEARDRVRDLGIEIRAGVHTGECELIDGKAGGIAVSVGARIGALAGASEVLVSQTVKDLVAGSGLAFDDRGEHELKGIPDRWRIYAVGIPAG
jgi:class 3 adenylate cyclase